MGFPSFHLYGFILGVGVVAGYHLSRKLALKRRMDLVFFDRLVGGVIAGGIAGARLYHVLDHWSYYVVNPVRVLAIWNGGLAVYGAILGSGIVSWIMLVVFKRTRKFLDWVDVLVPGVLLAQVIGRWGNYVNQEAFGPPTNWPWAVLIRLENRPAAYSGFSYFQPLFLYESLWNLLGLLILLKRQRTLAAPGRATAFYLCWYGVGRFFYEFGRMDTAVFGGYKVAQVISLLLVVGGLLCWWTSQKWMARMKSR